MKAASETLPWSKQPAGASRDGSQFQVRVTFHQPGGQSPMSFWVVH